MVTPVNAALSWPITVSQSSITWYHMIPVYRACFGHAIWALSSLFALLRRLLLLSSGTCPTRRHSFFFQPRLIINRSKGAPFCCSLLLANLFERFHSPLPQLSPQLSPQPHRTWLADILPNRGGFTRLLDQRRSTIHRFWPPSHSNLPQPLSPPGWYLGRPKSFLRHFILMKGEVMWSPELGHDFQHRPP